MRVQSSLLLVVLLALETQWHVVWCKKKGGECHESLCSGQVASAFLWRVGAMREPVMSEVGRSVCLSVCVLPGTCILHQACSYLCLYLSSCLCLHSHLNVFKDTQLFCVHVCLRSCLSRPLCTYAYCAQAYGCKACVTELLCMGKTLCDSTDGGCRRDLGVK